MREDRMRDNDRTRDHTRYEAGDDTRYETGEDDTQVLERPGASGLRLEEPRQRSVWVGITVRTLIALVVLVGGYVAAANYLGNRVPNGTSVAGVQIGNLTPQDARTTLERRLAGTAGDPVKLDVAGDRYSIDPKAAGLSLDLDSTLADLTGVNYDPMVMWDRLTDSGGELPLRTTVDTDALRAAVGTLSKDVDTPAEEGRVWLALGKVNVQDPVPGRSLDVPVTATAIADAWPTSTPVPATLRAALPALSAEEIDRFVTTVAQPALSEPMSVTIDPARPGAKPSKDAETVQVSKAQLARLLSVEEGPEHTLSLALDHDGLVEVVHAGASTVEVTPRNASVRLHSGRPQLVKARNGRTIDDEQLIAEVEKAVAAGAHSVTVGTMKVEPSVTAADAAKWDVGSVMGTFVSEFPTGATNAARTENIRVGLSYLNGTVVMPGEQFSLADTLAPISTERGYVEAGVINEGRLVKGMGGGLSQVSTTVLNTAWSSGVQLDEFTPHSYYISRYPVGREATISVGTIDNKWTNDTDSPIVIEAGIEGDTIVMKFWGDRRYHVETITGERRNVVQPEVKTDDSANCLEQHPEEGFDITVTRVLSKGGNEVSRHSYTTHYAPSPQVTCTNPAAG